jgi:hypothetical protein
MPLIRWYISINLRGSNDYRQMSHSNVRPQRGLSTAFKFLALSIGIATFPLAAQAELRGGAESTTLSGGANQTSLTGGASQTALTGGASQTALTGGASQTALTGGASQTALTGGASQTALTGGASQPALTGGASQTALTGGASQTALTGGASQTALTGGASQTALTGGASQTALTGGASQTALTGGASQTQLKGNAASTTLSTRVKHTALQGGIKDDASLNPSLKLLKPATEKGQPLLPGSGTFIPGQVTQISGHTTSGPLAPILQPTTAQPGIYQRPMSGTIPPLSTYTMTRNNSRMWVAPGYEVTPANTSRSTAFVPPTSSSSASATQKGVTTWVPGFDVTSISQIAGATASTLAGRGIGTGIAAYLPQYEVHKVTVSSPPMSFDPVAATQKGVTAFAPGYEVTVISHSKGVVSWTPGYELSKLAQGAYQETLSGVWHTGAPTPALLAHQGVLQQPQFTKILTGLPTGPAPMMATGLLLPQLRAQAVEKLTWDEWYKRVARAIYCRWQYAEVGPGSATIRMVVTKDRDISCQLIDFTPAADIKRDVAAETLFRESAVKAVNMVTKFEIPDLPQPLDADKVVFDLDLKRVVDGPVGVDVASRK